MNARSLGREAGEGARFQPGLRPREVEAARVAEDLAPGEVKVAEEAADRQAASHAETRPGTLGIRGDPEADRGEGVKEPRPESVSEAH